MTKDEVLKLALEALEWCQGGEPCGTAEAIKAIKAALAQPEACHTCAEIHAVLDADESEIIRNAQDGYPEGRTPHELTLLERVTALCTYAADWKRWCVKAEALAQPEQEPACPECTAAVLYECVACSSNNYPPKPEQEPDLTIVYQSGYYDGKKDALAKREWNFCERCGKRTADLTTIHTCTPPT